MLCDECATTDCGFFPCTHTAGKNFEYGWVEDRARQINAVSFEFSIQKKRIRKKQQRRNEEEEEVQEVDVEAPNHLLNDQ